MNQTWCRLMAKRIKVDFNGEIFNLTKILISPPNPLNILFIWDQVRNLFFQLEHSRGLTNSLPNKH
jgi:hypothetical protein